MLDNLKKQAFLVAHIMQDACLRDAHAVGDGLQRHAVVAALVDDIDGGEHNLMQAVLGRLAALLRRDYRLFFQVCHRRQSLRLLECG